MKKPLNASPAAVVAVAALSLFACAAPTPADDPPPEAVASTSQAIDVMSNCNDLGGNEYSCFARDGSRAGWPARTYALLDLLSTWGRDWVEVQNTGTSPVTLFVEQGFGRGEKVIVMPGKGEALASIDMGYPLYCLYMQIDDSVDPATVSLRVHKRN
ncbi:MAG: hypothetical protein JST00_39170 [Deltaproteobacteria bacterium]|nr:hypothetical protein [Deltaproteobacteria bacterium]